MQTLKPSEKSQSEKPDNLLPLSCSELLLGMYVFELDCPWSKTPFAMGGFHLKNTEDIEILGKHCKTVIIDINKGVQPRKERQNQLTILSSARRAAPIAASLKVDRNVYPIRSSVKRQIDRASYLYSSIKADFSQQAKAVRNGDELDLQSISKQIKKLIDSILINPQTYIWLLNTDAGDRKDTDYCVRAAVWAAVLGRQVGMHSHDINVLFMGALLADIGLQLLPESLVNKRGPFRKKELLAYRKHVDLGVGLVSHYPDVDDRVLSIIRAHHERQDGLGFPRGLRGEQISLLARFANLAYCFERLLYNNNEEAICPAKALTRLYKQRALKFPEQLVVELIHVMGTYPLGSLVELSSGEVALVLNQNLTERLSPKVAILTDASKEPLQKSLLIDLAKQEKLKEQRSIIASYNTGNALKDYARGAGIDPQNYAFSFFGKRVGIGRFSIRL
jgi:HD-GYP domain-containing protein (c-di-GMP phosphodiesterase class II)